MKTKLLITIALFVISFANAQNFNAPKFGAGVCGDYPIGGLSAKYDFNKKYSAQLVLGVYGPVKSITGRFIYNFDVNKKTESFIMRPFAFGSISPLTGTDVYTDSEGYPYDAKVHSLGIGVGAGLEMGFPKFSKDLNLSIDAGYLYISKASTDFESQIFGGIGIHYYFKL